MEAEAGRLQRSTSEVSRLEAAVAAQRAALAAAQEEAREMERRAKASHIFSTARHLYGSTKTLTRAVVAEDCGAANAHGDGGGKTARGGLAVEAGAQWGALLSSPQQTYYIAFFHAAAMQFSH
jgi:hypothetical protein